MFEQSLKTSREARLSLRALRMLIAIGAAIATAPARGDELKLVEAGNPVCAQVIIADSKSESLLKRAAEAIASTTKRWSGAELPLSTSNDANWELPAKPAIAFATLDTLKKVAPELVESYKELAQVATLDEQG